jgi:hypothetical protein
MAEDCDEQSSNGQPPTSPPLELTAILGALSNQLSSLDKSIQAQLRDNEQRLVRENETFKANVKTEIDDPRRLILSNQTVQSATPTLSPTTNPITSPTIPTGVLPQISTSASSTPSDPQSQLMTLMVELFTKLTTVLSERSMLNPRVTGQSLPVIPRSFAHGIWQFLLRYHFLLGKSFTMCLPTILSILQPMSL